MLSVHTTQLISLDIHQHILAFDSHRKHIHSFMRWILRKACLNMEGPRVPRTHDAITLYPTLTQWTPPMRADVIQGRQLSIHIRQADANTIHLSLHHLPRRRSLSDPA
jgi:hypothetical protein